MNENFELYRDALAELLYMHPSYGALARTLGTPRWDEAVPTAQVEWDSDTQRIRFVANPTYLASLTLEQRAAAILHETYHVVLDHLREARDPIYTNDMALLLAHECVINDTLATVFNLDLPSNWQRGPVLVNRDCTPLSTMAAYQLFLNPEDPNKDSKSDEANDDQNTDNQGSGNAGQKSESNSDNGSGDNANNDEDGGSDSAANNEGGAGANQDADVDQGSARQGAGQGAGQDAQSGPQGHFCGGVNVNNATEAQMKQAMASMFKQAAEAIGMTTAELAEELTNSSAGGYSPVGGDLSQAAQVTRERMNWNLLLARINPRVLEAGKRRRHRNDWTRYNRRMGSVYPQVILPKSVTVEPKEGTRGDSLPVMVIALDLSGSIDSSLIAMLQSLLQEIPEDKIRAFPCTWASRLIPFVPGGRVASGGTVINNVSRYVEQVAEETGADPYVLVITDGQFSPRFARPGRDWFFMGVDRPSLHTMKAHVKDGEEIYFVNDFRIS